MHHAYSVYITVAKGNVWAEKKIDHDITKLVSNVADTALPPKEAVRETLTIIRQLKTMRADGDSPWSPRPVDRSPLAQLV